MELNLFFSFLLRVNVDPYFMHSSLLEGSFIKIGLFSHFPLDVTHFHGMGHSPHLLNLFHLLGYPLPHLIGERFDIVRSAQGIRRIPEAHLLQQDLHGPEGNDGSLRCGNGVGLVIGTEGHGLGSAEGRDEGIISPPDDIIQGLFLCQTPASSTEESP